MNSVQRIIKAAGGNKAVAKAIGVDTTTVWRMAGFGGQDFTESQIEIICSMTGGLISPSQFVAGISGNK